ncbi:Variable major outer membrane lipoprotein [Borrelia duttonii CR2A]|uniref:Variable large protein n=1 Tax=Borrelia duttonii CR2A TaxID=1432657 RepID=W6TIZ3_9SPIR|nr:Variable major outer membrane lipoprotein [Borrelia duttonii CR2A]
MKKEKKGEGKVRVIIMMVMMMVMMGCNSGGVGGEGQVGAKSLSEVLMEVGRSAGDAFYSFLELVSGTLGFSVTGDTTKQQVGEYFNKLGVTLGEALKELEKLATKSETGVDKSASSKNLIRSAVDTAKGVLATLEGCLESLKEIGDASKVGEVGSDAQKGVSAAEGELKKHIKH